MMSSPLLAQKALRPIELKAEIRAAIENAIRQRLKNPQTATFGDMSAGRGPLWVVVCGWVDHQSDIPHMAPKFVPDDSRTGCFGEA